VGGSIADCFKYQPGYRRDDETKVSSEQPPGHKFISRGIIVTDDTFDTSDVADEYFDLFKKGELSSFDPIFYSKKRISIQDDPKDATIDIKSIVKLMHCGIRTP
jgi:hypothetical protein